MAATSIEGAIEGEAEVCQLKCPFVEPEKEAVERAILDDLLDAFGALPEVCINPYACTHSSHAHQIH
eukprot:m.199397 g.199397  ORF g.199397 m.199397 type:complete len:67 (+) comp15314_c1_seq7:643-843(+)